MNSIKKAIVYGFFVWLIPFLASFPIFNLKETNRPLFESIMPVVLSLVVVIFATLYFKKVGGSFFREGLLLGFVFLIISLVIDLFMFMWGPMKMPLTEYVSDIGLTYLMMPVITIGIGQALNHRRM